MTALAMLVGLSLAAGAASAGPGEPEAGAHHADDATVTCPECESGMVPLAVTCSSLHCLSIPAAAVLLLGLGWLRLTPAVSPTLRNRLLAGGLFRPPRFT